MDRAVSPSPSSVATAASIAATGSMVNDADDDESVDRGDLSVAPFSVNPSNSMMQHHRTTLDQVDAPGIVKFNFDGSKETVEIQPAMMMRASNGAVEKTDGGLLSIPETIDESA